MTDLTRLTTLINSMAPTLPPTCRHIKAALMVVAEAPACPARVQVEMGIREMARACREVCRTFNNLRSWTAALEREAGVPEPAFYEGEVRPPGELPTPGCNCDCDEE